MLIGDFNVDFLHLCSAHSLKFLSVTNSFSLTQIVTEPTRLGDFNINYSDMSHPLYSTLQSIVSLYSLSQHSHVLCCSSKLAYDA